LIYLFSMTPPGTFSELVALFLEIIDLLIIFIFALAFVVMAYKLLMAWIVYPDNEQKREEGKTLAITAVIVMFVMVSIWGILELLTNSFFG